VYELRVRRGRVHYRILYFFCGKGEACISHAFSKEGKVPDKEIDLAVARRNLAIAKPAAHKASVGELE
jgi:phage-related protein